jgi:glycopeptide antibiotics resistance protein
MTPTKRSRRTTGRLLISLVAVFTAVSPYLADWNVTHIYNPAWPPHAKFHNAQTMVLGAMLGFLSIYCLWFRKGVTEKQKLNEATVLASLYWLAQLPATRFPGVALADPGKNHAQMPVIFGIEFNQLIMDIIVIFPLIVVGYYLESRSLKKTEL